VDRSGVSLDTSTAAMTLCRGDWFHGVRAAHRSGTHELNYSFQPRTRRVVSITIAAAYRRAAPHYVLRYRQQRLLDGFRANRTLSRYGRRAAFDPKRSLTDLRARTAASL